MTETTPENDRSTRPDPRLSRPRVARHRDSAAWGAFLVLVLLVTLGLVWDRLPLDRDDPESEFLLGGIQVNEQSNRRWLDRLEATGFNTVSVTDYAHQGDWDSYNLWFDGDDEGEVGEIRAAKARGFRVVLILRVALDHAFPRNEFLWHGMIQPKTEEELDEWFYRYRSFALWWAETAEREGVDVLMLGSELNALTSTRPADELPPLDEWYLNRDKRAEQREALMEHADAIEKRHLELPFQKGFDDLGSYLDTQIATERAWAEKTAPDLVQINHRRALLDRHWRELIAAVRTVYHGPLGYAANFDQYREVGFWDALDEMGINAYFQLRRHLIPDATPEDLYPLLVQGWRGVLGEVVRFRRARGLESEPLIFTEMGLTYRADSTIEPWNSKGFSVVPVATLDQALAEMRVQQTAQRAVEEARERGDEPPPGPPEVEHPKRLVIWQDQPEEPRERALAVHALHEVLEEMPRPLLHGLLYWKLSSHPWHHDDEPFVLLIDEQSHDPLLAELQRFRSPEP